MLLQAVAVLLLLASPANAVQAQEVQPAATAGRRLLEEAAKACDAIDAVRYSVVEKRRDAAGQFHVVIEAQIVQQQAEVPDAGHGGGRYLASGTYLSQSTGKQLPFAWSYDGAVLRSVDHALGAVALVQNPDAGDAGRIIGAETGLISFSAFVDPKPFGSILETATSIELEGATEVAGVPCDLVAVTRTIRGPGGQGQETTAVSRWAMSREDPLPRMFEFSTQRREITRLEVNPKLEPADFIFDAPAGFEDKNVLARGPDSRGLLAVGVDAPAWELRDPDGAVHKLADLKGKVVLLDFWATWCGPCKRGMPGIQKLRERFGEDKVAIIGVNFQESPAADPAAYMKEQGLTYQLLLNGEKLSDAYKVTAIPTIYVIGPDGRISTQSAVFVKAPTKIWQGRSSPPSVNPKPQKASRPHRRSAPHSGHFPELAGVPRRSYPQARHRPPRAHRRGLRRAWSHRAGMGRPTKTRSQCGSVIAQRSALTVPDVIEALAWPTPARFRRLSRSRNNVGQAQFRARRAADHLPLQIHQGHIVKDQQVRRRGHAHAAGCAEVHVLPEQDETAAKVAEPDDAPEPLVLPRAWDAGENAGGVAVVVGPQTPVGMVFNLQSVRGGPGIADDPADPRCDGDQ